MTFYEIIRT